LPAANAAANVILRCGPSFSSRPSSSAGDPTRKLPAGSTTICGQCVHSAKLSPDLSRRSSLALNGAAARAEGKAPTAGVALGAAAAGLLGGEGLGPPDVAGAAAGGATAATLAPLRSCSRVRAMPPKTVSPYRARNASSAAGSVLSRAVAQACAASYV